MARWPPQQTPSLNFLGQDLQESTGIDSKYFMQDRWLAMQHMQEDGSYQRNLIVME